MHLVHVQWLANLTAMGRDQHLFDLELHEEVWEPLVLHALNTIPVPLAVC